VDGPDIYIAVHDYDARTDSEMSFKKGERLKLKDIKARNNWWRVERLINGQIGWAPSNYIAQSQGHEARPWYHGPISRSEAEYSLKNGIDGSFLVRESETNPGDHSISLKNEGLPYHYRIRKNAEGKLYILDEISFSSLIELVEYHSKKSDGLCVCLKYAVTKDKRVVYGASELGDQWELDRDEIELGKKIRIWTIRRSLQRYVGEIQHGCCSKDV